jgi:Family of unknown function (DUF6734)
MRAVWSFWSKPWRARTGGTWRTERHHLLGWILSFEAARKHYPDTELITDDEGARLLIDRLGLAFSRVSTSLNRLAAHDPRRWMLGKLYAYREQSEPFVHLDTDVFLWKKLPEYIENAPVFAQNAEPFDTFRSTYDPDKIRRALTQQTQGWIPREWEWALSFGSVQCAACCGVLGGRHVGFIRYYADQAIRLIEDPRNHAGWSLLHVHEHNNALEQYHLVACAEFHRHRPESPYRDVELRYLFDPWMNVLNPNVAARIGFSHLWSGVKQDERISDRLERRVKHDYPAHYARHFEAARMAAQ